MSALRVDRAAPEDLDAVAALMEAQFAEHAIAPTRPIAPAIAAVLSGAEPGFFLIARRDGAAIGAAYVACVWSLEHGGRSAWLEELYVLPDARGHGTGRRMLETALETALQAGCAAVDLEVDREHARAENLYRRHGFTSLPRARWVRTLEEA